MDKSQDYIVHWGIKGMKWGVRKEEQITSKERMNKYDNDTKLALAKEKRKVQNQEFFQQQTNRDKDFIEKQIKDKKRAKLLKKIGAALAVTSALAIAVYSSAKKKKNEGVEYIPVAHSGIKGMKWGVRNYQNEDGTLTEAGKARYRNTANGPVKLDARTMTNEELDYANNRFSKERAYNSNTGYESRSPGYKKNLIEKTAVSALATFALTAASSLIYNKYKNGDAFKDIDEKGNVVFNKKLLAKRVFTNAGIAAGIAGITAFASSSGKAQSVSSNAPLDTYNVPIGHKKKEG